MRVHPKQNAGRKGGRADYRSPQKRKSGQQPTRMVTDQQKDAQRAKARHRHTGMVPQLFSRTVCRCCGCYFVNISEDQLSRRLLETIADSTTGAVFANYVWPDENQQPAHEQAVEAQPRQEQPMQEEQAQPQEAQAKSGVQEAQPPVRPSPDMYPWALCLNHLRQGKLPPYALANSM